MTVLSERVAVDRVILWFDGTFDAPQAWQLRHALAEMDGGAQVTLDFSRVREFHDFAFALLAQDLRRGDDQEGRIKVEARGLCQHQLRLLKYLGVNAHGPEARPEDQDAEVATQPAAELR